jgi:hypothetical protein
VTKLLSREHDIAELKDLDELRSEKCNKVADIICKEIARLEELSDV